MFTVFSEAECGELVGSWRVERVKWVQGLGLDPVARVGVWRSAEVPGQARGRGEGGWRLVGVPSHLRYTGAAEGASLRETQSGLGRAQATRAALIPIRKSPAWWALAQDERREIMEGKSKHISGFMKYLPAIARQLYHSRDLGEEFDFLTWFEFAPEHSGLFDELVEVLRGTPEWTYVEREVDLRLVRG